METRPLAETELSLLEWSRLIVLSQQDLYAYWLWRRAFQVWAKACESSPREQERRELVRVVRQLLSHAARLGL